jgi:hypothetical protein
MPIFRRLERLSPNWQHFAINDRNPNHPPTPDEIAIRVDGSRALQSCRLVGAPLQHSAVSFVNAQPPLVKTGTAVRVEFPWTQLAQNSSCKANFYKSATG